MAYIGSRPNIVVSNASIVEYEYNFVATEGQTVFSGADLNTRTLEYSVGAVDVFVNGVRLEEADFTAVNGTSVTLAVTTTINDVLSIVSRKNFEVANTVSVTSTTGSAIIPASTEANRDVSPSSGYFRFNTDTHQFEGYNGTVWSGVGGGAKGGGNDQVFVENDQTITNNYTISVSKNAMSTGPVSINNGIVVTIESGSRWVVI
jgi:hypothetical protein